MKDFNCTCNKIYLNDSNLSFKNNNPVYLYDSNDKSITYQITKGTKVYIKRQGLNLNLSELNEVQIIKCMIKGNGYATLYMHKSLLR